MSDADDIEIDRSLFRRVRQERPSEALRQRIVALGRAELSRARSAKQPSRAPRSASRTRPGRAFLGAFIASAAGLGALLWWCGTPQLISISAENTVPRRAAPALPAPQPAPLPAPVPDARAAAQQLAPVPGQSPAALAPTPDPAPAERASLPQPNAQRPRPADAPSSASGARRVTPSEVEPATAPAAPAALPQSLAEQLEHIKRARAALRAGAAERALQLIDEYQNGGGSELAAEARLLRLEALSAAGRKDEAASEARRFATDYPTSPLIDRAGSFIKP